MFKRSKRQESAFNVGDRVIYKPIDYRDMSKDAEQIWYGAKARVASLDSVLGKVWIEFDDFPNCNYRENKNRFYADFAELELIDWSKVNGNI